MLPNEQGVANSKYIVVYYEPIEEEKNMNMDVQKKDLFLFSVLFVNP
jgi:hypothetical protein